MKNKLILTICSIFFIGFVSLMFSSCAILDSFTGSGSGKGSGGGISVFKPTSEQMVAALKEALTTGSENAGARLSVQDAFFGNAMRKIPLPPEAQPIVNNLNNNTISQLIGGDRAVNDLVLRINRAAEEASKDVGKIFGNAIKSMSFTDAAAILKGSNTEATDYFKRTTTSALVAAFSPALNTALGKNIVGNISALSAWNNVVSPINTFSTALPTRALAQRLGITPINSNLSEFVLDKAITAVFNEVADVEKDIRADPLKFLSKGVSSNSTKVFEWAKQFIKK